MEYLNLLFDTSDFPARWYCGNWSPAHGWTHIVSDLAIAAAYAAIPIALTILVLRRRDVPFLPIFWLFSLFIVSCGFGHLIEATIFWHPWYRFSAVIKACTAIVSWATVIALLPVLPKALNLPGLATVNQRLTNEIAERQETEHQLRTAYDDLEKFTTNVMGRENRIVELKEEVNALLAELRREPRYETEPDRG